MDGWGLLRSLPSGCVVAEQDGRVRFANPAFLRLGGVEGEALCERRFQDLLTPASRIFYETQFAPTLLMRGVLSEISLDLVQPTGDRVPVFVNAVLRREENGEPGLVLMTVFEARQRRRYEEELLRARKESEQMAEVVRRSSDAIVRLTADGCIQSWNNGAEQIFGYGSAAAIGRPLAFLFEREAQRGIEAAISELRGGMDLTRETVGRHRTGRPIEVLISMTPHLEARARWWRSRRLSGTSRRASWRSERCCRTRSWRPWGGWLVRSRTRSTTRSSL